MHRTEAPALAAGRVAGRRSAGEKLTGVVEGHAQQAASSSCLRVFSRAVGVVALMPVVRSGRG
jgi:hypothetical protein